MCIRDRSTSAYFSSVVLYSFGYGTAGGYGTGDGDWAAAGPISTSSARIAARAHIPRALARPGAVDHPRRRFVAALPSADGRIRPAGLENAFLRSPVNYRDAVAAPGGLS